MKIKTREDALLHCFDLWLWLAVTGGRSKSKWPGWKSNGGYLDMCELGCPVCEYSHLYPRSCCGNRECIIAWNSVDGSCCNDDRATEYQKWGNALNSQTRTKWALKIAALTLDAL